MPVGPEDLVAFRRRRENAGRPSAYRPVPASAPAPRVGPKRSPIGYVNRDVVDTVVATVLRNGDGDPTTFSTAENWLTRACSRVVDLDAITRNAVLNDPRVRSVISQIGLAAVALGGERRELARPDPDAPTALGWRLWTWDRADELLRSPVQATPWPSAELRVEDWDESTALRGVAGIHALRVPIDYRRAGWPSSCGVSAPHDLRVTGIVERFGRYVLGTEGWRAEWVFIRKLLAPSTEIGLALERRFPDVEVSYADR